MNMTPLNGSNKIVVVGGGAAGMMAAGMAAQAGAHVTLLEQNGRPGKKLLITGKGRCNVTNDCAWQDVLQNVPTNPRFLYSALAGFSPADARAFFEQYGCALKTERGNRVFPVSDRSQSVLDALVRFLHENHVQLLPRRVTELAAASGRVTGVKTEAGPIPADCVILATGGLSYPATGSTGDGFGFARRFGHTVTPMRASLVPLESGDDYCAEMQGFSLKNVTLSAYENDKLIYRELGEMLFTHFGVSGPLVLSASAHMRNMGKAAYRLEIDLKPGLDEKKLDARILRDFEKYSNKEFKNALTDLAGRTMIPVLVRLSGIPEDTKVNAITHEQRMRLLHLFKAFPVSVTGTRPIDEAIVTAGGVSTKEVNPRTMESKLMPGLYFAGEVLDLDGYTGGFNLQIAWSTGYVAGNSI